MSNKHLSWQEISSPDAHHSVFRSKIPGGWLVTVGFDLDPENQFGGTGSSISFVPDPEHKWDGGSVA